MAFTKVLPTGISSATNLVVDSINSAGVVTATGIVASTGTFSGNVSIAGTLTYEDVTNIDSVGLITARQGIHIGPSAGVAATLTADGGAVFTGVVTATSFSGDGSSLTGIDATQIVTGNTSVQTVDTGADGHVKVTTEGTERLRINSSGQVGVGTNTFGNANVRLAVVSGNVGHEFDIGGAFSGASNTGTLRSYDRSGAAFRNIGVSGANVLFGINDVERARIDSSGLFGLGTNSPGALLNTRWTGTRAGSTGVHFATSHGDSSDYTLLKVSTSEGGTDASTKFLIAGDGKTGVGTASPQNLFVVSNGGNDGVEINPIGENSDPAIYSYSRSGDGYRPLTFGTRDIRFNVGSSPSEKVRIDDAGRLLVGTNNARIIGADWFVQVEGTTAANSSLSLVRNTNSVESSVLAFGKSRSTSVGGSAIVSNGDYLGEIAFYGADGTDISQEGATIECRVDGTPGTNEIPSRLVFNTTEVGETSIRERWRINHEGILTNQAGHHVHGSQDFINNYRCQFGVYASAESGTNGNSAVGTGAFDSTYNQSEWANKTLTYGMAQELISEYNLSQTSRCNIGASFYAVNTAGNDNSFPDGGSGSSYWTPYSAAVWARGANNGGYQGYASVRADCQGYYGSSAAYYARVKSSPTSGRGHGFHCDLGGHVFGNNNAGFFVRQVDDQQQTGCTGFLYRRHNTSNTFNVLEVRNGANSTIGSIRCTNSNTSFNTSSDYRLKENVAPVTNGIELIKQMPVKTFNFIGDTETITGFLAHEIQDVASYAVHGVKDGTREVPATDENDEPILSDVEVDGVKQPVMETVPEYQSVDYGKLTPILTAALQEAIAKIETLEAQNAELAARLDAAGL